MNMYFLAAAGITLLGCIFHSWAGESMIIRRIVVHNLPLLREDSELAFRLLRVFWHIATILWFFLAMELTVLALAEPSPTVRWIAIIQSSAFITTGIYGLVGTRGKFPPGWVILTIGILIGIGSWGI